MSDPDLTTVVLRTTFAVRDLERSRAFYGGVLGMSTFYDRELTLTGQGIPATPGAKVKLLIMQAEDVRIGKVGLMQYTDPPLPEAPVDYTLGFRAPILVIDVRDVDLLHERLVAFGVRIYAAPHEFSIPRPDGTLFSMRRVCFWDPDGVFFEANERYEPS